MLGVWEILIILVVVALVVVLPVIALYRLRQCQIDAVARVLWAILIIVIPIMGAVAFFIVRPGRRD